MSAAVTLWSKHMMKLRVHPEEAVGLLIQPILWVVLFGLGMKGLLGQAIEGGGDAYITFMVPGIVALTALSGAISGGLTWLNERVLGIAKEYLAAPIPRLSILAGNASSIVTKALFQAIVILIVGVLIGAQGNLNPAGWVGGIAIVALFAMGFAGIALMFASKTNDPGSYHMVIFLINLPLLFMSNALYPLDALPRWMEILARANPTTYVVDGMRQTFLDSSAAAAGSELVPLWMCFVVVGAFAVFGVGLAYRTFRKSIG
jgi:ABC-2 type transport system permease protein